MLSKKTKYGLKALAYLALQPDKKPVQISEIAEKEGMEVIIMNGKPIDNLAKYLNGEEFKGTIIK